MKLWLVIGAFLIIILFVFGKETIAYFQGAQQYTNTYIKQRIPTDIEIARLKSMLAGLDAVIDRRREALVEVQIQAENMEKEVERRKARIGEDKILLAKVADMLAEKREAYDIGGIRYTYAEVDADAVIKAERFKQDKDMLTIREETLAEFPVAINEARKMISDGEIERQRLANNVKQLALRAERYKTVSQLDASQDAPARRLASHTPTFRKESLNSGCG